MCDLLASACFQGATNRLHRRIWSHKSWFPNPDPKHRCSHLQGLLVVHLWQDHFGNSIIIVRIDPGIGLSIINLSQVECSFSLSHHTLRAFFQFIKCWDDIIVFTFQVIYWTIKKNHSSYIDWYYFVLLTFR